MQDKTHEDRLKCLGLWTLEERRNKQDLIEVFKMFEGFSSVSLHELFTTDENIKGTLAQVVKTRCTKDIAKYFFLIKLLVDGICWVNGRWMLPASTLISLD